MTDSPNQDDRTRVVPRSTTPADSAATVITAAAAAQPVTSPATGSTDAGLLPVGSRLAEFEEYFLRDRPPS